jgi:hypothetical protein
MVAAQDAVRNLGEKAGEVLVAGIIFAPASTLALGGNVELGQLHVRHGAAVSL